MIVDFKLMGLHSFFIDIDAFKFKKTTLWSQGGKE
jgi:hypothetical protein